MKHMRSLTLLLAAGLLVMPLGGAAFAAEADSVKPFAVGQYTVLPLLENRGQMKIEIFSGPLSPEARAALMPGGVAPSGTTVFLVRGPAGNILIDTGWGASGPGQNVLAGRLGSAGLTFADIDLVLLTHRHSDHIGGLLKGTAPVFPKAKVLVSAPELKVWRDQVTPTAAPVNPNAPAVAPADLAAAVLNAYDRRIETFELTAPLP
ncbi:MAG: MBL fold metallo-hydrolase, partial [Candidatus Adiutrix sp.]|nr:MBL fold metallo-hydrolase [Candidatus Adiutrix sp.]